MTPSLEELRALLKVYPVAKVIVDESSGVSAVNADHVVRKGGGRQSRAYEWAVGIVVDTERYLDRVRVTDLERRVMVGIWTTRYTRDSRCRNHLAADLKITRGKLQRLYNRVRLRLYRDAESRIGIN